MGFAESMWLRILLSVISIATPEQSLDKEIGAGGKARMHWNAVYASISAWPFPAFVFVTGFLFAAGADPVRLGSFTGHDAALRLDFSDNGSETKA